LKSGKERSPVFGDNAKRKPLAKDFINQSLVYYNNKESQKCIDACLEALKLEPNNADAYNNIGAAYNQMGQWEKAIEPLTKALKLNPNYKLAQGNLNWAKTEMNKK